MPKYSEEYWRRRKKEFLEWLRQHPNATAKEVREQRLWDVVNKYYSGRLSKAKTEILGKKFEKRKQYSQEERAEILEKYLFTTPLKELQVSKEYVRTLGKDVNLLKKIAEKRGLSLETVKKIKKVRSGTSIPFQVVLEAFKLLKEGVSQKEICQKLNIGRRTLNYWKKDPLKISIVKEMLGEVNFEISSYTHLPLERKLEVAKQYFETDKSQHQFSICHTTINYWVHNPIILSYLLEEYGLKDKIFSEEDLKMIHPAKIAYFIKCLVESNLIYPAGRFYTTNKELAEMLREAQKRKTRASYVRISWEKGDKQYTLKDIIEEKLGEFKRKHKPRKLFASLRKAKIKKGKPPAIIKLLLGGKLEKKEMERVYNARTVIATQRLFEKLENELHEPVLDLGCGPTSPVLRATEKYVVCLDKNKEYLKFLKEKSGKRNVDYVQADATRLPFSNVPTITMTYLLDGMRKEDIFNLLVEAKKAVSKDGRIYIETSANWKILKYLETLLKLLKYDYRKISWRAKFSDGTSTTSYLFKIPSYTYEDIRHEFISFLDEFIPFFEMDKVVFIERESFRYLPAKKISIKEVEHMVKRPEYKVDKALKFMSELYHKLKRKKVLESKEITEIAERYVGKKFDELLTCIKTKEGIGILPYQEEEFWVIAAAFSIPKDKKLRNKYWNRIAPLLEAYQG